MITKKQIRDGNKLIALFMASFMEHESDRLVVANDIKHKGALNSMRYHSEWDWIMPVVQKIENIALTSDSDAAFNSREYQAIMDELREIHLEPLFTKVVAFISWYNKKK